MYFAKITAFALLFLGVSACASGESNTETVTLPNGVELPIIENGKVQDTCFAMGQVATEDTSNVVCVEFPDKPLGSDIDPYNWYSAELQKAGFKFAGGASVQYWFDWTTTEGCKQRLNLTAMPKTEPENRDVWDEAEEYVAVFELLPEECS